MWFTRYVNEGCPGFALSLRLNTLEYGEEIV